MAGGEYSIGPGERWLLGRGGEALATFAVWAATVLLRFLAASSGRAPFGLGTLGELVGLGGAFAMLLWSTERLAPLATRRLVPALAVLASAGYLVVSVTRVPLVEKYAARFESLNAELATSTDPAAGVLRGCRAVDEESFRTCLEGGFSYGGSSVLAILIGSMAFVVVLRLLVGRRSGAGPWPAGKVIDAGRRWGDSIRSRCLRIRWEAWVVAIGVVAGGLLILARLSGTTRGQSISISVARQTFQPGDLVRLLCVAALAISLARLGPRLRLTAERPLRPVPAMGSLLWVLGVPSLCAVLFMVNGDLGPLLVLGFTTAVMIWFGTDHLRYVALSLVSFALVIVVISVVPLTPDRVEQRFETWLEPGGPMFVEGASEKDCPERRPQVAPDLDPGRPWVVCYFGRDQVVRAQSAIAAGGVTGVGIGNGRAAEWVPEAQTDAAPVVVAEESGLIGSALVLGAAALIALESIRVGLRRGGAAGLFCAGFGVHLVIQAAVITGGLSGLAPLTGITLPLVSDGRSSSVTILAAAALVVGWSHLGEQERRRSARRGANVA